MLDLVELDASIKIRAVARMLESTHPMIELIRRKVNFDQFFYPECGLAVETVVHRGVGLLSKDQKSLLERDVDMGNRQYVGFLKDIYLNKIVSAIGKISLSYTMLWRQGKRRVGDLNERELSLLRPFIDRNLIEKLTRISRINIGGFGGTNEISIYHGNKFHPLKKLSSKQIREFRTNQIPICSYKIGLDLTVRQTLTWLHNINRLTSVRLKNVILRIAHGEVYTKERLHRFRLIDSPLCKRCNSIETLYHKFVECDYVKRIHAELIVITNSLRTTALDPNRINLEVALDTIEPNHVTMTLYAEILTRILQLKDEQTFLLRPKIFIKLAIEHLLKCESREEIKAELRTLL
jgi:hypothetical protein